MKWDSKLFQLLAFDGGLASIVRDILNDTGQLEQFYAIVRDNIEIFENSNSDLEEYHLYMPTAPLQEQTQRFNACSAQNYTRSMSQFPTSAHQSQANGM